jgi:hypothetical protein
MSGGIPIPSGKWDVNAGEEVVISFDAKPGYRLDAIQVNGEWLPPSAYIRLRADKDYEIVALGRPREQIRADFNLIPGEVPKYYVVR